MNFMGELGHCLGKVTSTFRLLVSLVKSDPGAHGI